MDPSLLQLILDEFNRRFDVFEARLDRSFSQLMREPRDAAADLCVGALQQRDVRERCVPALSSTETTAHSPPTVEAASSSAREQRVAAVVFAGIACADQIRDDSDANGNGLTSTVPDVLLHADQGRATGPTIIDRPNYQSFCWLPNAALQERASPTPDDITRAFGAPASESLRPTSETFISVALDAACAFPAAAADPAIDLAAPLRVSLLTIPKPATPVPLPSTGLHFASTELGVAVPPRVRCHRGLPRGRDPVAIRHQHLLRRRGTRATVQVPRRVLASGPSQTPMQGRRRRAYRIRFWNRRPRRGVLCEPWPRARQGVAVAFREAWRDGGRALRHKPRRPRRRRRRRRLLHLRASRHEQACRRGPSQRPPGRHARCRRMLSVRDNGVQARAGVNGERLAARRRSSLHHGELPMVRVDTKVGRTRSLTTPASSTTARSSSMASAPAATTSPLPTPPWGASSMVRAAAWRRSGALSVLAAQVFDEMGRSHFPTTASLRASGLASMASFWTPDDFCFVLHLNDLAARAESRIWSDCIPIKQRQRIPYLIISSCLTLLPWLTLGLSQPLRSSANMLTALFVVQNQASVLADVVIDAMVVEAVQSAEPDFAGDLQSFSWSSMDVGGIFGNLLGGSALFLGTHLIGVPMVGCVTNVLPDETELEVRIFQLPQPWPPLAVLPLRPTPWSFLGGRTMLQLLGASPAQASNSVRLDGMFGTVIVGFLQNNSSSQFPVSCQEEVYIAISMDEVFWQPRLSFRRSQFALGIASLNSVGWQVFVRGRCWSLPPTQGWTDSNLLWLELEDGQLMCVGPGRSYKFSYICSIILLVASFFVVQLQWQQEDQPRPPPWPLFHREQDVQRFSPATPFAKGARTLDSYGRPCRPPVAETHDCQQLPLHVVSDHAHRCYGMRELAIFFLNVAEQLSWRKGRSTWPSSPSAWGQAEL